MKRSNLTQQNGAVLAFSLVMLLLLTLAATRMIQQNKQQLEMSNNARLLTQEFANSEGLLQEAKNMINSHVSHDNNSDSSSLFVFNYFDYIYVNIPETSFKLPINDSGHRCTPNSSFKQNTLLAGTGLFQTNNELKKTVLFNGVATPKVSILSVSCKTDAAAILGTYTIQICSSYENGVVTCHPHDTSSATPDHSSDKTCTGVNGITLDDTTISDFNPVGTNKNICYQDYDPLNNRPVCAGTSTTCPSIKSKCPKEIYKIQAISVDSNGTTRQIVSDYVVGCGSG